MNSKAKNIIVESKSEKNLGFQSEGNWYNFDNNLSESYKSAVTEVITKINIGDKILIKGDLDKGKFSLVELKNKALKPKNWGEGIVHFKDLLDQAYEHIKSVKTQMLYVDMEKKSAIFRATITDDEGRVFSCIGDATQENIDSEKVKKHWIRMAETRALARALRLMTNSGGCSDVETEEGEQEVKEEVVK